MTDGQKQALEEALGIEKIGKGIFSIVERCQDPSGFLRLNISLRTAGLDHSSGGILLRDCERFCVLVPVDFPFQVPHVYTPHKRFAGFPHVQWTNKLCLYQAPDVEWNPNDGMFGLMERLWKWLERASLDELDPMGGTLHPPVAYPSSETTYCVIPCVNTPAVKDYPWYGFARLGIINECCVGIDEWSDIEFGHSPNRLTASCILLAESMPWEFPSNVKDLIRELGVRGVSERELILLLQATSKQNENSSPLCVLIGTPMRGIRGSEKLKQHLTAWQIDSNSADMLREIRGDAESVSFDQSDRTNLSWCRVFENRPEIVTRRDKESPMFAFLGKTVAVWGCGALGAHIALHLVRAGVKKLILYDNGMVTPGLLVRQPYEYADIGKPKAEVLAEKLRAIRPDTDALEVEPIYLDVLTSVLNCNSWQDGVDIVFDCTASRSVRIKLEKVRKNNPQGNAVVVSMIISRNANHGITVIAMPEHTGGVADVYRHAKNDVCRDRSLRHFFNAFYSTPLDRDIFQPEPGCSTPTFIGSSADVSALSALLLNMAGNDLRQYQSPNTEKGCPTAHAHYITQPHAALTSTSHSKPFVSFTYMPDIVTRDDRHGYEIRTSTQAMKQMEHWIAKSRDAFGPSVETGGLSFGEFNNALKVVWVTEASGPPPDSKAQPDRFVCGTDGTRKAHEERKDWSQGSVVYVGMWHTHPHGNPNPSKTDLQGMATILSDTASSPHRSLLSIIGTPHENPELGTYVFDRNDFRSTHVKGDLSIVKPKPQHGLNEKSSLRQPEIGLALSGGGSRAIAFHLGCLRALNKQGILDQVGVISAVSGGAVLAAIYAYSDDDFSTFDERVCKLLRRGFVKDIIASTFKPALLARIIPSILVAGTIAKGAQILNCATGVFQSLLKSSRIKRFSTRITPPLPRWASRTTVFETVLYKRLFGRALMSEPRRPGLDVVLNATELRTGTAFQFGSHVSANWRLGTVQDDVLVATAVAASAAYPLLLPSLHRHYSFQRNGEVSTWHVVLTDGGIYDNLGVTCLDPSRNPDYVAQVYPCERLICCNAGYGQWDGSDIPFGWSSRMRKSIEAVLREGQDRMMGHLFSLRRSGELKGLVLPYLGTKEEALQQDIKVGALPEDFVQQNQVMDYPTDFCAMRETDIDLLSRRGEQLTHLLADAYW